MPKDERIEAKARRGLAKAQARLRKLRGEEDGPLTEDFGEPPYCSFCGKGRGEYRAVVPGPELFICDGCVFERVKILKESGVGLD